MILSINIGTQYIQGGEDSFWLDTFQSALGASLGLLFGFVLYRYQRSVERKKDIERDRIEKQKEEKTRQVLQKDELVYFNHLIKGAVAHIQRVFESAKVYIEKQSVDFLELQTMKFTTNKDILRIDRKDPKLDFLSYRYFFSKNKDWIEDYKKLYKSLDTIQEAEIEIKRLYKYNSEENYRKLIQAKELLESTINKLASEAMRLAAQLDEKRHSHALFKLLDNRIKEYQKMVENKSKLQEYQSFLKNISQDVIDSYSEQPFANEILILSKRSRMLMSEVEQNIKHFIGELKGMEDKMGGVIQDIKSESNKIEQTLIIS